ncbi:MAG: glycosyltransferase [Bacteroidales bacterium]|nr:glycosyltransferase [Bacteroidales bacterium]
MRIAILSTFYPLRGGIAQFNADLLEAFAAQGHQVRAFTFSRQYPDFLFPGKTQYVTEGDDARKVDSEAVLDTVNPFSYFSAARKIARWQPDLVVVRYWMSFFAPSLGTVIRCLRRRGIKVVTILDNVLPHEPKFFDKPFTRWFLRQNEAAVVMSDKVLSDLDSLAPSLRRVKAEHPIYDHFGARVPRTEARLKTGLPQDARVLLFFGFIREYKGLDILIDAMSYLGEEYHLLVAGEPYGSFEPYQQRIDASAAKDRIHLEVRYIGDNEVPRLMSAADVCVLPYRSATQSGITGITTLYDVPCIATPVGGLGETVGASGIGLMAEDCTPQAVAAAVSRFFEGDREPYLKAMAAWRDSHTWRNFAEAVISCAR